MSALWEMIEHTHSYVAKVVDGKTEGKAAIGRAIASALSAIPHFDAHHFSKLFNENIQVSSSHSRSVASPHSPRVVWCSAVDDRIPRESDTQSDRTQRQNPRSGHGITRRDRYRWDTYRWCGQSQDINTLHVRSPLSGVLSVCFCSYSKLQLMASHAGPGRIPHVVFETTAAVLPSNVRRDSCGGRNKIV